MGQEFFTGWKLWQQMTFVLACGIVATVVVGLCKLMYDRRRISKYSKVAKGKQAETPQMLEAQPISSEPKDEIPFGIRAIESGIEVQGVWISRSNTPVGSRRSSMTLNDAKLPRGLNNSQLELPKATYTASSRDSSRAPSSAFDHAVSAERLPSTNNNSRSSSPGRETPNHHRGRAPVASSSRYSNSNYGRNSTTLNALEGADHGSASARYEPFSAQPSSSNSGKSSRNSDESDYLPDNRPYEAAYINPRGAPYGGPIDPRTDLDLLQSHRMSHVAETGQLTPRVRRPGMSGEWASVAENMRSPNEISTANGVEYFVPQKAPSHATAIPLEEMPAASASRYHEDAHASNQARQAMPLLETYAPQAQQFHAYQPRGPQHDYEEEQTPYEMPTPPNERDSQVIRKVNAGFEILRPGTFGEPPSPEDDRPVVNEKRQSKRLQKKRRSTNSSTGSTRTSHFVEQV